VVACGVETPAQLSQVLAAGCRQAQGYALARPGPAERAEAFLESRRPATR
jgi:EAL domain-containing protein (putative c-di-GMP-specific phosphodiesterase class I)